MKTGEYNLRKKRLSGLIDRELGMVDEEISNLSLFSLKLKYTTLIIAIVVIALIALFTSSPQNFLLYWLMSSFVFLMVNPFIFLLPTGRARGIEAKKNKEFAAAGIYEDLKKSVKVMRKEKKLFVEFGWKLFFINCQPLAPGFIVIFSICMLFGAMLFAAGIFDRFGFVVIVIQCLAIMVFYAGIWFVRPYSREFLSNVLGIRVRARENYQEGLRSFFKYIFVVVIFAAVGGIAMILAILLPGFTLGKILEEGIEVEFKILFFIVIFVCQVILVRYIQGGSSRNIVGNFLALKRSYLRELKDKVASMPVPKGDPESPVDDETGDALVSAEASGLEMNLFRTDYHHFMGYFPVCLLSPNVKVLKKLYDYYPGIEDLAENDPEKPEK